MYNSRARKVLIWNEESVDTISAYQGIYDSALAVVLLYMGHHASRLLNNSKVIILVFDIQFYVLGFR